MVKKTVTSRWEVVIPGEHDDTIVVNSVDGTADVKVTLGRVTRIISARDAIDMMNDVLEQIRLPSK